MSFKQIFKRGTKGGRNSKIMEKSPFSETQHTEIKDIFYEKSVRCNFGKISHFSSTFFKKLTSLKS